MTIRYLVFAAALLISLSNCRQKVATPQPPQPAATGTVTTGTAPQPMLDVQTLADNHKILLARVAGDLSKLPESLRNQVATQKPAFNAAFETLKSALEKRESLRTQLSPADWAPDSQTEAAQAFRLATAAAQAAQDQYDELARQFAVVIQEVRKVRGF